MVVPTTGPKDTERTRSLWFALLLTLANGFLDAHTYLARGGVFANVQTANVIFGAVIDNGLKDEVRVTVIATGFGPERYRRSRARSEEEGAGARTKTPEQSGFEVPEDILEVPSFLRDP